MREPGRGSVWPRSSIWYENNFLLGSKVLAAGLTCGTNDRPRFCCSKDVWQDDSFARSLFSVYPRHQAFAPIERGVPQCKS